MRPERPDHYATLGLPAAATGRQITHAFRSLVRALHPDTTTARGNTHARFTALTTAYQVLHDPARRAAYDRTRHTPPPPSAQTGTTIHVTIHVTGPAARPAHATLIPAPAHPATRQPLLRAGPVRIHPLP